MKRNENRMHLSIHTYVHMNMRSDFAGRRRKNI